MNETKLIGTYYDMNGQSVTSNTKVICAKEMKSNNTGQIQFYIRSTGTKIFNPENRSFSYKKEIWKFKKVTEVVFKAYLQYLRTKNGRHLTKAERQL